MPPASYASPHSLHFNPRTLFMLPVSLYLNDGSVGDRNLSGRKTAPEARRHMPADPPTVAAGTPPIARRALKTSETESKPRSRGCLGVANVKCDPLISQAGHPPELAPGPWGTGCRASQGRIPPPLWIRILRFLIIARSISSAIRDRNGPSPGVHRPDRIGLSRNNSIRGTGLRSKATRTARPPRMVRQGDREAESSSAVRVSRATMPAGAGMPTATPMVS